MPATGDHRSQVSAFLSTRRARLTPQQAGVPLYGGQRRVAGLRREEVAQLAGVSTDYYARLERGNLAGASEEVLDALARALQLDDAERGHLHDLARTSDVPGSAARRRRTPRAATVRPGLVRTLDAITDAPAFVVTLRRDVLAANRLGRALYAPMYESSARPVNTARFAFLDPRARDFFLDWHRTADDTVANLRTDAGRNPHDRALTDLIGELATRSEDFATRWASHDVRYHHTGTKGIHHPVVGDLVLSYEVMVLPADPDQSLITYTAEPATPAADGLRLLATWAATTEAEQLLEPATDVAGASTVHEEGRPHE
ncbi:helix-turn-helix transcriptional regulator [Pseudokineococcus basanitobsidens]|uniref:Helix-turn-helix transcriptional regulator n=1 Tax=Pseudokineococcus basanitobsidens TaxID=1926649 RepID=A0ABU8RLA1_9ACTN